ncbi:helix-turn-helix domain-containing protein [[Pseudomonas] boreopolis]
MPVDTLSGRIRSARVSSGLSQTDLARALHVNRSTVGHWEREQGFSPTVSHLQDMSRIMGVSLSWLLTGHEISSASHDGSARSSLESRMFALSKHLPVSFLINIVALMETAESYL